MIAGDDGGNCAHKTSEKVSIPSKVSKVGNILKESSIYIDNEKLYIGEGHFDTEYRKVNKPYFKALLIYAIAKSTNDICNKVVSGLPIGQYKEDKDKLKNIMLKNRVYNVEIDKIPRKIILEDFEVYPEGVAAVIGTPYQGIIVDLGGRTLDCAEIEDYNGIKKIKNPISYPVGMLNLYSDFIKVLNSKYTLELRTEDADRIITNGLKIDGKAVEITEGIQVFKGFVDKLVSDLELEYNIRNNDVILVGGGCKLLGKALLNRIPSAIQIENYYFANAFGFKRVGEQLWR